jgi:hypothetical protein
VRGQDGHVPAITTNLMDYPDYLLNKVYVRIDPDLCVLMMSVRNDLEYVK